MSSTNIDWFFHQCTGSGSCDESVIERGRQIDREREREAGM